MVLDSEIHRQFFLEMFKQVNFPGNVIELAVEVKKAVETASVKTGS
jgi:hypothetical protein